VLYGNSFQAHGFPQRPMLLNIFAETQGGTKILEGNKICNIIEKLLSNGCVCCHACKMLPTIGYATQRSCPSLV